MRFTDTFHCKVAIPGRRSRPQRSTYSRHWHRERAKVPSTKQRLPPRSIPMRLFRIWGHEFAECVRKKAPRDVRDVCREFKG